jgi:hypothetical protein
VDIGHFETFGDLLSERWWAHDIEWSLDQTDFNIMIQWCHEQFGIDESRWTVESYVFFFMQRDDFLMFRLTWV